MDAVTDQISLDSLGEIPVFPTTFESFTIETIRTFKDPEFKPILALAKDRPPTQKLHTPSGFDQTICYGEFKY